ncbi:MAG TPA: putative toxin-antitoxin system toxin component, PIN family [Longilinea sp.]|nr:putative toxin-antitoxin system toxin component, PIN family [Longilinea sp.]
MIVVLDTNTIVSALLSPNGTPAEIFRYLEAGKIAVATSDYLLDELERVLTYPKVARYIKASETDINLFVKRFRMFADIVQPESNINAVEKDPDDNHVLECAVAAKADFLITGDQHLLELEEFEGIEILSPTAFMAWFSTEN